MNPLKRFRSECKGSVATVFAIAILPIMVGSGMALDYSRAVARRTVLQNALDGAMLSVSRSSGSLNNAQLEALIETYIRSSEFGSADFNDVELTRTGTVLNAVAYGNVQTTLMQLVGIDEVNIAVSARATWSQAEVVLVLDNSGGISSSSRLTNLRNAAKGFVSNITGSDGSVLVGVMPYAVGVRVPPTTTYKNYDWILFNGDNLEYDAACYEDGEDGSCTYTPIVKSTWQGCMTDRRQPHDVSDTFYNYNNLRKYPARLCRTGESTLQTVLPLTTNAATVNSHLDGMVAGGGTNITIGVAWGHALLSNQVPFQASADASTRKILILVAGTANTLSRHSNVAATLNTKTLAACSAAKSAGIEIYTVSYSLSTVNDALLQSCATRPSNFYDVASTANIANVFTELAKVIRKPKLTH